MRNLGFFKAIAGIALTMMLALLYVHQEVEIVKTSFDLNKNREELSLLLDQYRSLVYNLSKLESPKRIEDTLSLNEIILFMPDVANIHHVNGNIKLAYNANKKETAKESMLARIFDRFSVKAEAKVIQ